MPYPLYDSEVTQKKMRSLFRAIYGDSLTDEEVDIHAKACKMFLMHIWLKKDQENSLMNPMLRLDANFYKEMEEEIYELQKEIATLPENNQH